MSIHQLNLYGKDKVEVAIDRFKTFEPPEGYYLAFSGGKDSVVIKALADMSGVKYDAHYNVTSVDPPELIKFIRTHHPDVAFEYPKDKDGNRITMWNLIPKKKMPPTYKIDKPIRLIELFAGVGSQTMALRNIGADFEHWKVVEFDKYPVKSYNAIHGTDFEATDICNIHGADLEITDTDKYCYIMTYSFPCQDLSAAGKGKGMSKGSGTRSGLLWEVERLIDELDLDEKSELPQVLLMENVPQVHGKKNIDDFNAWLGFLESKGYSNHWADLNAKNYGIAQNRNRCFCVSILGDYDYKFPEEIPLTTVMADYLDDEVDEKYYINSDRANELIQKLIDDGTIGGGLVQLLKAIGITLFESNEWGGWKIRKDKCSPTIRAEKVCVGAIVKEYESNKHSNENKNLCRDTAYRIRKLTPKECWRLMGFTDEDFHKAEQVNSNTQLYKQAGNSIVVNVLEAIFKQMIESEVKHE